MVRRAVYNQLGGYNPHALYVEDYELWVRALAVTEIANMFDTLLLLRKHHTSVSHTHQLTQQQKTLAISRRAISSTFGEKVPVHYFDAIMLHRLADGKLTFAASSWMAGRCFEYLGKDRMSEKDKKAVRSYSARKLYPLALICLKKWPLDSIKLWQLILKLDPAGFPQLWMDLMSRMARYPLKCLRAH